jgi:hypothetical protein
MNNKHLNHYNFGINYVSIQGCLGSNFEFSKSMKLDHIFGIVSDFKSKTFKLQSCSLY